MKKSIAIIGTAMAAVMAMGCFGLAACTPEVPEEVVPEIKERVRYSEKTNPYAEVAWDQIGNLEDWSKKSETAPIYYQFEGNYAEGYQGDYSRDFLYMDCYEDGSLYATCQNDTFIGWWSNVTDAGSDTFVLHILTQNNREYNGGLYEATVGNVDGSYYEYSANIVRYMWGGNQQRIMPINGYHYSPIKSITVTPTSSARTKYVLGDRLSTSGLDIRIERENGKSTNVDAESYQSRVSNNRLSFTGFDAEEAGEKTITVSYKNEKATGSYKVQVYKVTGIELDVSEAKTDYHVGQAFTDDKIKVYATVEGTTEKIDIVSGVTYDGYDAAKDGTQTVTAHYGEFTATFDITSYKLKANGFKVDADYAVDEYHLGDTLDTDSLLIEAEYEDNITDTVLAEDCTITSDGLTEVNGHYELTAAGEQTITFEFGGQTQSFTVTVYDVTSFTVDATGAKTEYYIGDKFDPTGIVVKATFADNETEEIDLSRVTFDGFSSDEASESITVTVTFTGKEQSFNVKVIAPVFNGKITVGEEKVDATVKMTGLTTFEVSYGGKTVTVSSEVWAPACYGNSNTPDADDTERRTQWANYKIYTFTAATTDSDGIFASIPKQVVLDQETLTFKVVKAYKIPDGGADRQSQEPMPGVGGNTEMRYLIIDEEAQTVTITYKYFYHNNRDTIVSEYTIEGGVITLTKQLEGSSYEGSGGNFDRLVKAYTLNDEDHTARLAPAAE